MFRKLRWFFIRPIFRLLDYQTEAILSALTDLQSAVKANTLAIDAAIAAIGSAPAGVPEADVSAAAATIAADAARLAAAVTPAP